MTFRVFFETDEDDVEGRTLHEAARILERRMTKDEVAGRPKPPERRITRGLRLSTDHSLGREIRGVSEAWRIVSSSFPGVAAAETRAPASRPQIPALLSLSHFLALALQSTLQHLAFFYLLSRLTPRTTPTQSATSCLPAEGTRMRRRTIQRRSFRPSLVMMKRKRKSMVTHSYPSRLLCIWFAVVRATDHIPLHDAVLLQTFQFPLQTVAWSQSYPSFALIFTSPIPSPVTDFGCVQV